MTLQELVEPNHLSLNRLRSNGKVKVVPDKESVIYCRGASNSKVDPMRCVALVAKVRWQVW